MHENNGWMQIFCKKSTVENDESLKTDWLEIWKKKKMYNKLNTIENNILEAINQNKRLG